MEKGLCSGRDRMNQSEGPVIIARDVGEDGWGRMSGDAVDERWAKDVTTEVFAGGGTTDKGEKVRALHDLEYEIGWERQWCRDLRRRCRRTYVAWSPFPWRHRSCVFKTLSRGGLRLL